MSHLNSQEIKCLKCDHIFPITLFNSVNVTMSPDLKEKLLSGKLNQACCPECKMNYNIETDVLYHDMNNGIMIQVLLSSEHSNNREESIISFTESIRKIISSLGTVMRENFERYSFDIVFSTNELQESLDYIERNGSEKIRKITSNVLKLDPAIKTKERSSMMKKIKEWFS